MDLDTAIANALRADDAFVEAVREAGYRSRWDWIRALDDRPELAYCAKVEADREMHTAFCRVRNRAQTHSRYEALAST
jgi:hypothetical protein